MRFYLGIISFLFLITPAAGQSSVHLPDQQRLDFARSYFEVGGKGYPAYTGSAVAGEITSVVEHPSTIQPYLTWGGFHFWGHTEFYVVFPLQQLLGDPEVSFTHAVVTGMRLLPWAYRPGRIRPYAGASWSAQSFRQGSNAPAHNKDFSLVTDAGLLYGADQWMVRLGVNYFHDNKWEYPVSPTAFETIASPRMAFQFGVLYSFDSSRNDSPENVERWNSYAPVSRLGTGAERRGDFFLGVGPSASFSLESSGYTRDTFPFLQDKISSGAYFDAAVGYQSNRAGWFAALSFRNPGFESTGYNVTQSIQKYSVALEFSKFIVDYTGFAPYVGLNVAYDHLTYEEVTEDATRSFTFRQLAPGLTFGWDIVPGKTSEYLILRTNLRWYPFSRFDVDGRIFAFSQLEYNLIQAVFYPGRLLASRK